MKHHVFSGIFILLAMVFPTCGCMEPPIKKPAVSVSGNTLSDISLQAMTANTTVNIFNPNPVGAELRKIAFDVWYLTGTPQYLSHGEQSRVPVKENGNTTITFPVRIGTIEAAQGVGSLVQKGSVQIRVNGSAIIDLKLTSCEKSFEQHGSSRLAGSMVSSR